MGKIEQTESLNIFRSLENQATAVILFVASTTKYNELYHHVKTNVLCVNVNRNVLSDLTEEG